jgi:hypothetical protein
MVAQVWLPRYGCSLVADARYQFGINGGVRGNVVVSLRSTDGNLHQHTCRALDPDVRLAALKSSRSPVNIDNSGLGGTNTRGASLRRVSKNPVEEIG